MYSCAATFVRSFVGLVRSGGGRLALVVPGCPFFLRPGPFLLCGAETNLRLPLLCKEWIINFSSYHL